MASEENNSQNIYLFSDGICCSREFIESDIVKINNNGDLYFNSFQENENYKFAMNANFMAIELIEGDPSLLVDDSGDTLTDENGNILLAIE